MVDAGMKDSEISSQNALEIKDLVVSYGNKRAVDGLSFTVPVGSVFGFLGPNGAGKTSTIKTLLGFRNPTSGSAHVLGYDIVKDSIEVRSRTGYVSEVNSLYDGMTVSQICSFCKATSRKWDQPAVDRYMNDFQLPVNSKVGKFSKGMKSQLALSLAIGSNPDLLILDEPTSGLDPIARHEFLNKLVGEIAASGKTVFFSSHVLSEVEAVADRVGVIKSGKLIVADELDHLKQVQKVIKVTYIEMPPASEIEAIKQMHGVIRVEQEGRSVRIIVKDSAEKLIEALKERPLNLRDIETVNMNLEDIFLSLMKEGNS